jgi:hypothetical protein
MMLAVAVVAAWFGLGLPAALTWREDADHTHTYIFQSQPGMATFSSGPVHLPFLTRYRRRLCRIDREDCGRRLGYTEEACTLAHPEIVTPYGPRETPSQTDAIDRISGNTFELWQRHPPSPAFRIDGTGADSQ